VVSYLWSAGRGVRPRETPHFAPAHIQDYVWHGTTTLFAALDIQSGEVLTQCKRRHRHQEFGFLQHVGANVPARFDVHLVLDNYGTQNTRG
jgi:hypothetical protein